MLVEINIHTLFDTVPALLVSVTSEDVIINMYFSVVQKVKLVPIITFPSSTGAFDLLFHIMTSLFSGLVQFSTWHALSWMISQVDLRKDHGGNAFSMDTALRLLWWY